MRTLQTIQAFIMNTGSMPASKSCYEKVRLSGIHFHDDSILSLTRQAGRSRVSTAKALEEAATKKRKRNGGTGVYFEDVEVKPTDKRVNHPLQSSQYKSHRFDIVLDDEFPCPEGQPLFAPPVLPATLQGQDSDSDIGTDDEAPIQDGRLGLPAPRPLKRPKESEEPIKIEEEEPLFCERKRTALRNRLHGRDYRLSTDELVFVEAAVKLSEVVLLQPSPPIISLEVASKSLAPTVANQGKAGLTKPKLPLLGTDLAPKRKMPIKKRPRSVSVDPYLG